MTQTLSSNACRIKGNNVTLQAEAKTSDYEKRNDCVAHGSSIDGTG
jgi:hypothetical protein